MTRMVEPVWKRQAFPKVKKRARIPAVSKKQRAKQHAWADVVEHFQAKTTTCWACDVHYLPACNGRYEHTHHILPRSAGGPDTKANALPCSRAHHDWIHDNPDPSYDLGLLERRRP